MCKTKANDCRILANTHFRQMIFFNGNKNINPLSITSHKITEMLQVWIHSSSQNRFKTDLLESWVGEHVYGIHQFIFIKFS